MWLTTVLFYFVIGYFGLKYLTQFLMRTFVWGKIDPSNEISVKGKVVVITGANTGIGKETAIEMAKRGATVVLACRNFVSAKEAMSDIEQKVPLADLVAMKLDLASLDSVREFAMQFKNKYSRLDILINNAGVYVPPAKTTKTKEGFEIHFGVNHLGHFLLTTLLLDTIKKSTPARIINVSSILHNNHKLDLDDVNGEKKMGRIGDSELYADSKMANILFTKEFAKRLEGTGVQTYALCPGLVATDIGRHMSFHQTAAVFLLREFIGKPVAKGAETTLFCALSKHKDVVDRSGEMYMHCCYWPPEKRVPVSDKDALKLWEISEKLIGSKKQ